MLNKNTDTERPKACTCKVMANNKNQSSGDLTRLLLTAIIITKNNCTKITQIK